MKKEIKKTLLIIFTLRAFISQKCFSPSKFPILYGGSDDNTDFTVFDRDLNGNFVIGASSFDRVLLLNSDRPNAFILFLNNDGTQRWVKAIDVLYEFIAAIKFSPDGASFVFITDDGSL